MSYQPKQNSVPARAISVLEARGALTTEELADALGLPAKNVRPNLQVAVHHGLLHFQRDGKGGLWHLGMADDLPGDQAIREAQREPEAEEFACALYNDGDLVLINAGTSGDVAITLPKAQASTLVRYLMSFAHEDERNTKD